MDAQTPKQTLRQRIVDGELGGYVLLAPAVIVLLRLTVSPLIYSIGISTTEYKLGAASVAKLVGGANYVRLLGDGVFIGSLLTTAKLLNHRGAAAARPRLRLRRDFRSVNAMPGARFLRTVFILPTMITPLCIALFWAYIFDPLIGVANFVLAQLHLPALQWVSSGDTALPTLILVYLREWTPFTTVLLLAGLLSISPSIYEAARIDGAGWYNVALRIDIPLLGGVIPVAAILAVVEVVRIFDLVYGTTQGGPGTVTLTNAVAIYRIGFQNFDTGYAAATSLVILVATILIAQWLAKDLLEEAA